MLQKYGRGGGHQRRGAPLTVVTLPGTLQDGAGVGGGAGAVGVARLPPAKVRALAGLLLAARSQGYLSKVGHAWRYMSKHVCVHVCASFCEGWLLARSEGVNSSPMCACACVCVCVLYVRWRVQQSNNSTVCLLVGVLYLRL